MKTFTYRNKRNENKYLVVRFYKDGHAVMKQYMEWSNGVRNYTGCSLRAKNGRFHRVRRFWLAEILDDYSLVA